MNNEATDKNIQLETIPLQPEGEVGVGKNEVANMSAEDRATALRIAMDADPGIPEWSWRMLKFNLMAVLVMLCGNDSGFDSAVMSSVNSMKPYQTYFHIVPTRTSVVFGLLTVGTVCSSALSLYFPDKVGRRWAMFVGNIILIAGALISSLAHGFGQFVGGRFVTGFGAGLAGTAAKAYLAEITLPKTRGRYLGGTNCAQYLGQLIATSVAVPFGKRTDDWSWRAPLLLQALGASINMAFVLFLPESPRWLYAQGKTDKAVQVLANLHSRTKDVNSPLVRMEIGEIEESIEIGGERGWWDPRPLFNTRSQLIRFGMGMLDAVFQTLAGNGLVTYFLPTLLGNAGIKSTNEQRILNVVNTITSAFGAISGLLLIDHIGRRPVMLFSEAAMMCIMAIIAGTLNDITATNVPRQRAGIAFIFIFMSMYSVSWTPITGVYPTECFAYTTRAKGLAYWQFIQAGLACINTFALPIGIANLNARIYIIFVFINLLGFIMIYIFAVETRGLSLEELDYVFDQKNPKAASFQLYHASRRRARAQADAS